MRYSEWFKKCVACFLAGVLLIGSLAGEVGAQEPSHYSQSELDRLVGRIALYPDPLVAQILAAATFPDQIPEAGRVGR